jgi:hypothetical protein
MKPGGVKCGIKQDQGEMEDWVKDLGHDANAKPIIGPIQQMEKEMDEVGGRENGVL